MTIEERSLRYIESQCKGCRNEDKKGRYVGYIQGATEQKAIDIDKVCADNVITDIGKVMLDPTISCKTKAELVRVILTKAIEE